MLLDEIGVVLDAEAEFELAVNLFLGSTPANAPDTCLTVYEYAGAAPVATMGSQLPPLERPRIQVVARSKRYVDARALIDKAWRYLHLETSSLTSLPTSSPFVMGKDDSDRIRIGFNSQIHRAFV